MVIVFHTTTSSGFRSGFFSRKHYNIFLPILTMSHCQLDWWRPGSLACTPQSWGAGTPCCRAPLPDLLLRLGGGQNQPAVVGRHRAWDRVVVVDADAATRLERGCWTSSGCLPAAGGREVLPVPLPGEGEEGRVHRGEDSGPRWPRYRHTRASGRSGRKFKYYRKRNIHGKGDFGKNVLLRNASISKCNWVFLFHVADQHNNLLHELSVAQRRGKKRLISSPFSDDGICLYRRHISDHIHYFVLSFLSPFSPYQMHSTLGQPVSQQQ